jgi:hypothetical protein
MSLAGCGGGSSTSETVTGLSTPAGVELITDNSSSSSNLASLNYAAFTDVGTDYSTDKVRKHIYQERANRLMEEVDVILCLIDKTQQKTIVNGEYLAVLDTRNCTDSTSETPFMVNMTIDTSRASNTANQITKGLYEYTREDAPASIRFDIVVSKEPTNGSPYGELTIDYLHKTPTTMSGGGSLIISSDVDKTNLEYINNRDFRDLYNYDDSSTPYHEQNYLSYIDSYISSDGSSGLAKVGYVDNTDLSKKLTYKLNWDENHIAQYDYDTNDALTTSSCTSRSSFTEEASNYKLYDTDGKRIDLTTYVYGYYTDVNNESQRAYIGKRGAWFSGGETGAARPTTITTRTGESLSIEYDVDDTSNWDTDNDGMFATVNGVVLDDYIRFGSGTIPGDKVTYNDSTAAGTAFNYLWMGYSGNYFWGIPWVTVDGKSMRKLNINDGTLITDNNGVDYILKQRTIKKTPTTVDASNCSNLTANAVDNESNITSKTSADIRAVDANWVTPSVGTDPRVIDGVIQF